jgi:hypothetical protein
MREDDDDLRHYVPLLRRIIVLVAAIIAVPVMLWTITVFVRTYVGPPRVPTFDQLASTASINAPTASVGSEAAAQSSQGMADGSGPVVEAGATVADARDGATAKGSMLGDRSADPDIGAPRAGEPAGVFPPSPLAAPDSAGASGAPTSVQAGAGAEEGNRSLSSSQPLSGPIPLPRRRPHEAEMLTADNAISNVPMPRRRPEGAGSSAPAEATGSNPIGFIQNLFH